MTSLLNISSISVKALNSCRLSGVMWWGGLNNPWPGDVSDRRVASGKFRGSSRKLTELAWRAGCNAAWYHWGSGMYSKK